MATEPQVMSLSPGAAAEYAMERSRSPIPEWTWPRRRSASRSACPRWATPGKFQPPRSRRTRTKICFAYRNAWSTPLN